MSAIEDAKAAARAAVRRRRRERTPQDRQQVAADLAANVLALPEVAVLVAAGGGTVTAYASYRGEPGTGPLVDRLRAEGVRVLLPVVVGDGVLAWADYDGPATVATYDRGIPEPIGARLPGTGARPLLDAGVRVVLLPGLAVSTQGHRLGQGGGYYDRLCAALPRAGAGGPLLVALVHDDEVLPPAEVPADEHDVVVDAVVTPERVLRLDDPGRRAQ